MAGLAAIGLAASACASGGGSGQAEGEAEDAGGVVNMVMAPDPVWKWLEDQGIKQEMEEAAGIQILTSSSWDEFGVYAGGHADVISAATYEVPDLEEATGDPATVFGAYNTDRSILAVRADNPAQSICDLAGQRIATFTNVSITLIWGMYAKDKCDLDLQAGGGDFELVVTDIQNLASLVARGDADACLCLPDFGIPELSSNQIKPLYDGQSAAQFWAANYAGNSEDVTHPQTNVFVAREAWVERNPDEAQFLIELWDRGIQEWQQHRDEIIAAYPEDFAVRTPEEMAFLQDWLDNRFDWFVPTAFIDDAWVEGETEVFDLMRETGFMGEDVENPSFTTLQPES
ncbi:ABC transporter substrate-binding protein [Geodermatophilus ruber]|nr:ABC transporter substrate-binding protein [Geodermatophilus ruber]